MHFPAKFAGKRIRIEFQVNRGGCIPDRSHDH
jgi:hypothetical protein